MLTLPPGLNTLLCGHTCAVLVFICVICFHTCFATSMHKYAAIHCIPRQVPAVGMIAAFQRSSDRLCIECSM